MFKKSIETLRLWAKRLKSEVYMLYVATRDPRTPAYARYFSILVIGYALSPIDLIPDFIPVLGLLDDLILLPVGIALLRKMIPPDVIATARQQSEVMMRSGLPASRNAAMIVMMIWALIITAAIWWVANQLMSRHSNKTGEAASYSIDESLKHSPNDNISNSRESDRGRSRQR